jgi:hypothetical protein
MTVREATEPALQGARALAVGEHSHQIGRWAALDDGLDESAEFVQHLRKEFRG